MECATKTVFLIVLSLLLLEVYGSFPLRRLRALDPPKHKLRADKIETKWITQKLDHFNLDDTRTWEQRYFVNTHFFNQSSKKNVYLKIGGEGEISQSWMNYGAWYGTAKKYGGLMFSVEHRYYGQSQPFRVITSENLKYLSSLQALEDLATFIREMNKIYKLPSDVKWIVNGGSYPGSLAAWMRQRYPDLVAGAVSSSGPLEAKLDFFEYYHVVADGMATHSQQCLSTIRDAFAELDDLISNHLNNSTVQKRLDEELNLCTPIKESIGNKKDIAQIFTSLIGMFATMVQYHLQVELDIDNACEIMLNTTSGVSPLSRLANLNSREGPYCIAYKYDDAVKEWSNTDPNANDGTRQWLYQTCTEFGFFQTTDQQDKVFGNRVGLEHWTDLCVDLFGREFNEVFTSKAITETNNRYHGKNIETSNIVYFNGNIDPWHVLGKLEKSSKNSPYEVIIVKGVSHCASMYEDEKTDPDALLQARKEIDKLVGHWLGVNN